MAESVRLQAELHEKEKTILRQQRKRCQKVYKDLETLRSKMNEAQGKAPYAFHFLSLNKLSLHSIGSVSYLYFLYF